jgi:hypothetical protein
MSNDKIEKKSILKIKTFKKWVNSTTPQPAIWDLD